jgi:hypothetical protein
VSAPPLDPFWAGLFDIAKVLVGGLLAAGLALFFSGRRQDRDLERAGRQLAIRLIDLFERFAYACAEVPSKNAMHPRHEPYDFGSLAHLPALDPLPDDDAGWRAIEPSFAIDGRTFGGRIEQARGAISWAGEGGGDADDMEVEINHQSCVLGEEAWNLARRMREHYGLGEARPGWDIDAYFAKARVDRAKYEADRAEQAAIFWEGVAAREAEQK